MVGHGDTDLGRAVAVVGTMPIGAGDARFRVGETKAGGERVDTVYLGAWPCWVLERVGGFDEGMRQNQDYELAYRIRQAGGTVWLDPAIRSVTLTRGTVGALARQYWRYGQGRAATLWRHPRSLRWRQSVPMLFVAMMVAWVVLSLGMGLGSWEDKPTVQDASRLLALGAFGYASLLAAAAMLVTRREGWRVGRYVPVALATMHVAWGAGAWFGLAADPVRRLQSGDR